MTTYSAGLNSFVVQKQIVSNTLTTGGQNIIETVGNGLLIEDCVVTTDSTGLGGATALQLKADGIVFYQTAVSGLGASAAIDLKSASVTGTKCIVPAGTKYITAVGTVGAGTGAGVATVTITMKKLDTNSGANSL